MGPPVSNGTAWKGGAATTACPAGFCVISAPEASGEEEADSPRLESAGSPTGSGPLFGQKSTDELALLSDGKWPTVPLRLCGFPKALCLRDSSGLITANGAGRLAGVGAVLDLCDEGRLAGATFVVPAP